jgi:hypothetical protein
LLVQSIGTTDLTAHLATVRTAIETRMEYQIELNRQAKEAELRDMWVVPGMPQWDLEMRRFTDQLTQMRLQTYPAVGAEQDRLLQREAAIADFRNQVIAKEFEHSTLRIQHSNATALSQFQAQAQIAQYLNAMREDQLKEMMLERSVVIDEFVRLIHGGQQQIPQFQGYTAAAIQGTDIVGAAQQGWQNRVQQQQRQQDAIGGVLGLGAQLLAAPATGGLSLFG